jgi:hypothetical protein
MSDAPNQRDLLIVVADRNMEATIAGILSRPQALRIREVVFDMYAHPHRDSGCCHEGVTFLNAFLGRYHRAVLMFDREGSGRDTERAEELERDLEYQLEVAGWQDRTAVLVLEPELESWVWSDSPHVASELGWNAGMRDLRTWLEANGFWQAAAPKPIRPKEALEVVLKRNRRQRSSAFYRTLAEKVSFRRCTDRSFLKLVTSLQGWFGERSGGLKDVE